MSLLNTLDRRSDELLAHGLAPCEVFAALEDEFPDVDTDTLAERVAAATIMYPA